MFLIPHLSIVSLSQRLGAVLSLILAALVASVSAQSFSTNVGYTVGENPNSGIAADFNGQVRNKSLCVRVSLIYMRYLTVVRDQRGRKE